MYPHLRFALPGRLEISMRSSFSGGDSGGRLSFLGFAVRYERRCCLLCSENNGAVSSYHRSRFLHESTVLTSAMRSDEIATKAKHWFGLVSAVFDRRPVRLLKTDMMLRIFAGLATSHRAMELYWLGPTTAVFNGYVPKLLKEDIS